MTVPTAAPQKPAIVRVSPNAGRVTLDPIELARQRSREGGGPEKIAAQHAKGKMTARERIAYLLDPGSFMETDSFAVHQGLSRGLPQDTHPGDGVVTGYGKIHGRSVCIYAQDFTVSGGSLGSAQARKICKIMEQAIATGVPLVALNDSGGARIQEGVAALGGYGDIFQRHVDASGVIPQVAGILGPCAGGAVYGPALTDFVLMTRKTSYMYLTGPDVVKTVLGEETTHVDLGGADVHANDSGVCHLTGETDEETLDKIRALLSYLPQNHLEHPPRYEPIPAQDPEALRTVVPPDSSQPYDMRDVMAGILDRDSFFEIHAAMARNVVVGFGRVEGRVVGIVANQPKVLAGVLDVQASEKAARFVRFCDAFNVPLLSLVDVPGFLPGREQEHGGIIRHGAKLLYAYCEATVPKITVVTRKAYGGAYIVMCSKHLRSDVNLAWPQAEIAVLGAQGAVQILHRRELKNADEDFRKELEAGYRDRFGNPMFAAELGFVDDIIDPATTRAHVSAHLARLASKHVERPPRKHGNIPL
ncbi:MAG: methylmalonyl-CoA decarboxylase subunit alpha [Thermoplasmata archaeon]|nr:methylmalonyl-CoA decarboxylase subunit alpha [Thermoplasmata archaeon]